ncbi:MAG: hypothetical protein ABJA35_02495 [Parafilimonas sp.]
MAIKKSAAKKSHHKKTFLEKVGNKASNIKDDLIAGKDHLVEIAGEAFDSVKEGIQHITKKKKTVKKSAKKTVAKKAKVAAKKVVKKAAPKKAAKPTAKKVAKRAVKESAKPVSKKR